MHARAHASALNTGIAARRRSTPTPSAQHAYGPCAVTHSSRNNDIEPRKSPLGSAGGSITLRAPRKIAHALDRAAVRAHGEATQQPTVSHNEGSQGQEGRPLSVGALVVGGGPSGYATCMALSKQGFQNILLLERSIAADDFDPLRGFVYSISAPGRAALTRLGLPNLEDEGLTRPGMNVKYLNIDGSVKEKTVMLDNKNEQEEAERKHVGTWIPRHTFNGVLYSHVAEKHAGTVKVMFSTTAQSVQLPKGPGDPLVVTVATKKDGQKPETMQITCRLLVAADGANSMVRGALESAQPGVGWGMEVHPSDAGGLAFKVLPLPPCPVLSTAGGELPNPQAAVVSSQPVNGEAPLRLGLLPVKDMFAPRTANFILWPSHPFWKIRTPSELYEYLEASFPQLDRIRENVPEEVAQKFVDSRPGRFKDPQACKKLVAEFPDAAEADVDAADAAGGVKGASVVLLGDAAHVFPPDIGQGVNSALLDVATLSDCIGDANGDLSSALRKYEEVRLPETAALVRIMQYAVPYQYRQAGMKLKATLWTLNCSIRLLLSKVLPSLFSQPLGLTFTTGSRQHKGSYQTLYRATETLGHSTTRNLYVLAAILAALAMAVVKFVL